MQAQRAALRILTSELQFRNREPVQCLTDAVEVESCHGKADLGVRNAFAAG